MMPDPRTQHGATTQFPPPNITQAAPAQVLDPSAPGYDPKMFGNPAFSAAPSQEGYETDEYGDYYGTDLTFRYVFPDGKTWIEFKELNEGDLARYQKILKRDIVVEKSTGNARITVDQVEERHVLLMVAVTGWNMHRRDASGRQLPLSFSNGTPGSEFMKWVQKAKPSFVIELADAIRKENPFLVGTGQETIEAIDKQIEDLMEQRRLMVERMQGEAVSANS